MRRFRSLILSSSLLASLAFSAPAIAADTSWETSKEYTHETIVASGTLVTAWSDPKKCGGKGQFYSRSRSSSGWGKITPVLKTCNPLKKTAPRLIRDTGNGNLYIFWGQASITNKRLSGIQYVVSKNKGRSWSNPHFLIKTPKEVTPVQLAAAARGGVLWVMYHKPGSDISARRKSFLLEGYSQKNDRKLTKNIATKTGVFASNVDEGSMKLSASKLGLVAYWQLTDIGGRTRDYAADTTRSAKSLVFRGEVNTLDFTRRRYFTGENGLTYLLMERDDNQALVRITQVWRWRTASHKYVPTGIDVRTSLIVPENTVSPAGGVGVGGDSQGNTYLMYLNFEDIVGTSLRGDEVCFTLTWTCSRGIAPNPTPSPLFILKQSTSGQVTTARLPMPFGPTQTSGSNMIEWIDGRSGMEAITTQFGGVRMLWRHGWENISTSGSIGANEHYVNTLSDPLTFN